MVTVSKGEATRKNIVEQARVIFNEQGIGITLENIAREMGISKSRISNHFPTKDSLFMAILRDYEGELATCLVSLYPTGFNTDFQAYVIGLGQIMDIQFKYRCGILYLNLLSPSQHELKQHVRENFERNTSAILGRLAGWVKDKILEERMLEEPAWSGFLFAYVNLLTQWVVHYDMYDSGKSYAECKQNYLRSTIIHLFTPYLTAKGKKIFSSLHFPE